MSSAIAHNTLSASPNQKNCVGVFVLRRELTEKEVPAALQVNREPLPGYEEIMNTYDRVVFNALGEGQVNVCGENGDIEAGDYITTSSVPGKGMKQESYILHNYTVAKARESVTFKSSDEIKQIACIYVCG
ncbi:hypothetical protein BZG29_18535 [Janthinobacterium sp. LM6]|nr:hypothetical protein BZG29_18535 [Janthinobacterium sp. LM6]